MVVSFSLTKILVPAWKLYFSLINFKSFSYWPKPFHSFFLLTYLTIFFCVLDVGLPFRWHSSLSLGSTLTSMSNMTDGTIFSKSLSGTFSGIRLETALLCLPYWAKSLWFDSSMATLFSRFSHFTVSLAFSFWKFLITTLCLSDW